MSAKKLLIIGGPTATGKTDVALELAGKFNGELVSADSRQVYKYMDIGTGKDIENGVWCVDDGKNGHWEISGIPIWMLDLVTPDEQFTVADYCRLAWQVIEDIWERGKLPIIVGGTGFYIKSLIEGVGTLGIVPDEKLRVELAKLSVKELQEKLQELDSVRFSQMNNSDRQNPRRLVRAIEIAIVRQKAKSPARRDKKQKDWEASTYMRRCKLDILFVGLTAPRNVLYQRIDARVDRRMSAGMVEEVENLLKMGVTHQRLYSFGLEYRYIDEYLQGKTSKTEMVERLKLKIHDFARRQLTWFKKQPGIEWFDITKTGFGPKLEARVAKW